MNMNIRYFTENLAIINKIMHLYSNGSFFLKKTTTQWFL